jgi:uncharacterized protein (DUF2062 family)
MKLSLKPIGQKFMQAIRQGISPRQLAVTCALGVVMGLFPVLGATTLLCLAAALIFKLNLPVIQLVNYLVAPLQIILMLPLIKVGTYVFGYPFNYTFDDLISLFKSDLILVVREAGVALLLGIGVWILMSIPLFILLFFPLYWFFSRWRVTRYREL